MKKIYLTPKSEIVPIKTNDILTSSTEHMRTITGSWDEEEVEE